MSLDSIGYFNVNKTSPYLYGYCHSDNFATANNKKSEYTPNIVTQNKDSWTGKDVAKGLGILTLIAIGCDFLFCKGKHVKQLTNGVDDLFKTKKSPSVKPSKPTVTADATLPKPNVTETVKPTTQQPVNPVLETPISKTNETSEIVNQAVTQPVKTPLVETATCRITEPIKIEASEITHVEKLNPNISYQEAHKAKVFADEKNHLIRQREHIKANGGTLPTNAKTEKLEAEIKEIDDLFKKATQLDKDYVVYRGLDIPEAFKPHDKAYVNLINDCKVGDVIKPDAGYTFVGLEKKNVVGNYAPSGLFTIRVPKGAKLIYHDGWEALMPRNAQYKVLEKTVDNKGRINFVLEYIV